MRLSRDAWVTGSVSVLLIILAVLAAVQQSKDSQPPALASFSAAPDGGRAFKLWLEELGYTPAESDAGVFGLPEHTQIAFILEPALPVDESELRVIDRFVDEGGILVAAGSGMYAWQMMQHFDFELRAQFAPQSEVQVQAPWGSPAVEEAVVALRATAFLRPRRSDFITHLAAGDDPVLVSFRQGRGQVFLSATAYPFSNEGLKEAGLPAVAANLLAFGAEKGAGTVWFDEWHHGVRPGEQRRIIGPGQWLRRTPAGQGLLFAAGVIFIALALEGRGFGRPVRPPQEQARRRPLEHIRALANLSRRAGIRSEILRQYHRRLKRDLGSRYRLDPALSDAEWVAQLAQLRPNVDAEKLLALLNNLQRANVSEGEMVRLVREAAEWVGG